MKKFTSSLIPYTLYLIPCLFFCSCALLGIHVKVENPKHADKYPKFSKSTKLLGNQNTKYRNCFDATFYDLKIFVDHKNKYLKGKVEMYGTALSDFDTLQIDLYPNMIITRTESWQSVNNDSNKNRSVEAYPLYFFRKYGGVFITMPRKVHNGEKFILTIFYEGSPLIAKKPPWKGGFVWEKDKEKNPWIGVACETEGASLWWPCKDVNNDEPDSAAINITVAKDLMAVSNGKLVGKEENGNFTTYKWFVSYPINLYDVTLYIGNFKLLHDSIQSTVSGKTLPINNYALPYNYEKAKTHFLQAKEQLSFYEKTFGEYPWYKDGYKLVESPYEGMEHQSAIAYGNGYKTGYPGFDYIILHESAHEWWGNSVSAADLAEVWIHEGFATYSEALYVESTQGKDA